MKIRTDILRLSKELHTWVGISTGILLFICFFAGGLSMFQHDLSKWATPPQQQLAKIQPNQYNDLVAQLQAEYPETQKGFSLSLSSPELHNAPIQWKAPVAKGADDEGFDTAQSTMLATLDAQGHLHVQQENVSKLGWLLEQLHETAGIPGLIGHHALGLYVMGIVSVLYFLAILSGLIVLLPTLVKDYFAIRKGKNKKRFWLDTHNVVGITSLPFHIIICISVIVFAFHDLLYDAIGGLALKKDEALFPRAKPAKIIEQQPKLDVENILYRVQKDAPEYQIHSISFSRLDHPEKASARIALYHPDQMLRGDNFDFMNINPYQTQPYKTNTLNTQSSASEKVIKSMFSLHFGNFGGDFTRWMYFLLGIGGAFLFYSGNILWIESRIKRQKNPNLPPPQQRKDVVFVSNLTISTCLGSVLAIAGSMFIGRWSYVFSPQLESLNHIFFYAYYALFVAVIVYVFTVRAAKALPILLLTISLCCALLPLTSILAYLLALDGLWYSTGRLIVVDVIALLFALAFLRFYQQAKQRALHAEVGGLWKV